MFIVEYILELDALLLCLELQGIDRLLDHFMQIELGCIELELRVFYLRKVQQVVDQVEKHGRAEKRIFKPLLTLNSLLIIHDDSRVFSRLDDPTVHEKHVVLCYPTLH